MGKIIHGNLINIARNYDVIIHGCNCFNTMGSGIAAQIRKHFPEAWKVDQNTIRGDKNKLGELTRFDYDDLIVVNAYTQYDFGGYSRVVSYDAIDNAFSRIAREFNGMSMAYPMIGAGLGRGHWPVIKEIIDYRLQDQDHTLVVYNER